MALHFENGEFPYSHANLPSVSDLISDLDWQVICLFDGGRWDYYDSLFHAAEPVQSPPIKTNTWVREILLDRTRYWGDLTYIRNHVRPPKHDDASRERLERNLSAATGEYHNFLVEIDDGEFGLNLEYNLFRNKNKPYRHTYTKGAYNPEVLVEYAIQEAEPPIIIQFLQPHTPIKNATRLSIGEIDSNVIRSDFNKRNLLDAEAMFDHVRNEHMSPDLLRVMYYHNYQQAIRCSWRLFNEYDRVIRTAPHAVGLGPTTLDDTVTDSQDMDQLRTVPFDFSWNAALDDPDAYEAAPDHEWVYGGKPTTSKADLRQHTPKQTRHELDDETKLSLESLGYR